MGKFEDKIKLKLEGGQIPLNPAGWSGMETRLDNVQMSDLVFTQKISNAFNFSVLPYTPKHWESISKSLDDMPLERGMDKLIQSKFSQATIAGTPKGWDSLLEKLEEKEVVFNSKVKQTLEEGSVSYRAEHWKAIASKLPAKRSRLPYYLAAALASLVMLSYGVYELSERWEREESSTVSSSKAKVIKGSEFEQASKKSQSTSSSSSEVQQEKHLNVSNNERISSSTVNTLGNKNEAKESAVGGMIAEQPGAVSKRAVGKSKLVGEEIRAQLLAVNVNNSTVAIEPELPELSKQNNSIEVVDGQVDPTLHLGLSPWLTMVNNPAFTGMYGKRQVFLNYDQEYKSFFQYGINLENRWNQPLVLKGGYEQQIGKYGWNLGGSIASKVTDSWRCTNVDLSLAKEQKIGAFKVRAGADLALQRNKLVTEELSFIEQASVNSLEDQLVAVEQKIPVDQYLTVGFGLMVMNENFMVAYRVENAALIRINYSSEKFLHHEAIAAFNVPLSSEYGLSVISKMEFDGVSYFVSPGFAFSYKNGFYALGEYQYLNRGILNLGYQFDNGLRMFAAYGQASQRELESRIRNMYSYSGHIGFGINYVFKK